MCALYSGGSFMTKIVKICSLFFLITTSAQAGFFELLYGYPKTTIGAFVATALVARACWAKYVRNKIERLKKAVAFGTATNRGSRLSIEDRHYACIYGTVAVAGVFDGHNGIKVSDWLADNFFQAIKFKHPPRVPDFWSIVTQGRPEPRFSESYLKNLFYEIDKVFDNTEAGSTAVCAFIDGGSNILTVANLGDSRAVLAKKSGFEDLSQDHKPNKPAERERFKNFPNALIEGERLYIKGQPGGSTAARSFGDSKFKTIGVIAEPDVMHHAIASDDQFVILASDAIWDCLSSEEAVNFAKQQFKEKKTADEVALALIEHASCCDLEKNGYRRMDRSERDRLTSLKNSDNKAFIAEAKQKAHDNQTVVIIMLNSNLSR